MKLNFYENMSMRHGKKIEREIYVYAWKKAHISSCTIVCGDLICEMLLFFLRYRFSHVKAQVGIFKVALK